MRFRRKADIIEAMQLTKGNREALIVFVGKENVKTKPWDPVNLYIIKNNSEDHLVMPGHYVIKEQYGTFQVLEPNIFEAMYEGEQPVLKK